LKSIRLYCLLALLLTSNNLFAQLTNYSFLALPGTYTPITGTAATISGDLDDGTTGSIPIGFSFNFNGVNYTTLGASTNGFLRLGIIASSSLSNNLVSSAERPALAPLWDDLALGSSTSISYGTTGTAPNRICTIQWSNVFWNYNAFSPGIEFQVKLYETTNTIEFVYRQLAGSTSGSASIGISAVATGSGNFLSLSDGIDSPTISSTTENVNINTRPPNGQVYRFTPASPCTAPPTGGTTASSNNPACPGVNFTLSVSGSSSGTGLSYNWQSSADGNTFTDINGATGATYSATQAVTTYYRRKITCSGVDAFSTSLQVNAGAPPPVYASLPYLQNFESAWVNGCSIRDLPSANWRNTPASGNNSWRREDDYLAGGWSSNTGWSYANGADGSLHAARFNVYNTPAGQEGNLDLYVDCSVAGDKEIRFKHINSFLTNRLEVYYSTDGGNNFTLVDRIAGTSFWRPYSYSLPSNAATTIVRFKGTGSQFNNDIGLDDVEVLTVTCLFPANLTVTNIQQTSATVGWDVVAGATGYEYAITGTPVPPASGTATTANSVNITGLTGPATYYLHTRARCSPTSTSSWQTKAFTTSIDCTTAIPLTCGTPLGFTTTGGSGGYNLFESDPAGSCGVATLGTEKLFKFTTTVSGNYSLRIINTTASYPVHYYIKNAALGCAPVGWTCVGTTSSPGSLSLGNLTAGTEYFILLDHFTIINNHSETIDIICPPLNDNCSGAVTITPGGQPLCSTITYGTTIGASASPGAPAVCFGNPDDDVWYRFTATSSTHLVNFTSPFSPFDFQVLSGSCGSLVSLGCGNINNPYLTGLTPGTSYYLRMYTDGAVSDSLLSFCISSPPVNEICASAQSLTVNAAAITGTTYGSDLGTVVIPCLGYSPRDVWYSFVAPTSVADITVSGQNGFTPVVHVMSDCTGTTIDCSGTGDTDINISLNNLVPGDTYFIQVGSNDALQGYTLTHTINVSAPVTTAGIANTCMGIGAVTINTSNNNQWVPLLRNSGEIVGEIKANNNNLGSVQTSVYVHSGPVRQDGTGKHYLSRNITISPAVQPTSGLIDVRLFIKGAELSDWLAATGAGTVSNLGIFKNNDACIPAIAGVASPVSVTLRSGYGSDYILQFSVNSFSSFYFGNAAVSVLPLKLIDFSGRYANGNNYLRWETADEVSITGYEVERSADGVQFTKMGYLPASGAGQYEFTDAGISGTYFYRLRIMEQGRPPYYSKVVAIRSRNSNTISLEVFPNPVQQQLNISVALPVRDKVMLTITDVQGRVQWQDTRMVEAGSTTVPVNVQSFANGVYIIKAISQTGKYQTQQRFVK
jgi:Secretion system C-terminal sorting domain